MVKSNVGAGGVVSVYAVAYTCEVYAKQLSVRHVVAATDGFRELFSAPSEDAVVLLVALAADTDVLEGVSSPDTFHELLEVF